MRLLVVILISVFSFISHAHDLKRKMPTPLSVSWLGWSCIAETEKAMGFCDGAIELAYSSHGNWCVPSNTSRGEVKRVIKREIVAAHNGEYSHIYDDRDLITLPAHKFIWDVIEKKWPCS